MVALLDGTSVLDFTHIHAGPLCTYQLALMGASVLKVEPPGTGDQMRQMGRPHAPNMSAGFIGQNANKRSIAIDLKSEPGLEVVHRLIAQSDVMVLNMRPGTADRIGIGLDQARRLKPDIVYCAISGYGQSGPESDRPAMDHLIQGESGMFNATGTPEHAVRVGFSIGDSATAIIASSAVAAALYRKARTHEGAFLDVSMLESCMAVMGLHYYGYFATGQVGRRPGQQALARIGSAGTWPTADGILLINANNLRLFHRLARAIDRADLIDDPKWSTLEAATVNGPEMRKILGDVFVTNTAAHWDNLLRNAGVPSGRVKTPPEVVEHSQLKHRGTIASVPNVPGFTDPVQFLGAGFIADEQAQIPSIPPPLLGQHSREVMQELGYTDHEIASLIVKNILEVNSPAD